MLITANPHEKSEAKPVKWIGRKLSDRSQHCMVEAESWAKARELAQAELETDEVDVVREDLP